MTTTIGLWTVGGLAGEAGVTSDAIRHWEREGLFPAPERSEAGYRRYGPASLDRARFIRDCQRAGLRLADIADLLAVRDTGVCPCEPAGEHLERRIAEVAAEISRLESLRSQLTAMLGAVEAGTCEAGLPDNWCPPKNGDGGEC